MRIDDSVVVSVRLSLRRRPAENDNYYIIAMSPQRFQDDEAI